MDNDVYYKILLNSDNKYCVVCMQWFDENDYNQDRFLCDKNGEPYKFFECEDGKAKAKEFLNKVVKPEFIREKDLITKKDDMFLLPIDEWED